MCNQVCAICELYNQSLCNVTSNQFLSCVQPKFVQLEVSSYLELYNQSLCNVTRQPVSCIDYAIHFFEEENKQPYLRIIQNMSTDITPFSYDKYLYQIVDQPRKI